MKKNKLNDDCAKGMIPIWTTIPVELDEKITVEAKANYMAKSLYWRKYILKGFEEEFGA